jgi:formate hydrogenlyase subunit 3/multisubunit Na+/H+ antiporter MnhD subunit
MLGLFIALGLLVVSGLAALVLSHRDRWALAVGSVGALVGCGIGTVTAVAALLRHETISARWSWSLPVGELHIGLDALSSFFLACLFLLSGLAALFGWGYLQSYIGEKRLAPAVALFNWLVAAMASLVVARDGVLFLMAWEAMSITSFFLVAFEHEREDVRRAAMTYLIASQLGAVFLFVLFAILAGPGGSFDFDVLAASAPQPAIASACFLLALIGFGTKAGLWPLHIWLPDAHPAAPSHVSAVMSGAMIKMGIYGLLRSLTFLGPPRAWWGWLLLGAGSISGLVGILHALGQRDLKRTLAYSSIENIGIIAIGLGLGLIGMGYGNRGLAALGFAGALLHVLNHGLLKSILFQAAGSVVHAAGTRDLHALGGLSKSMPVTAMAFLFGSVGLCGLPPLNAFVGEWLIYVGAFQTIGPSSASPLAGVCTLLVLGLLGGLAAACYVRTFGTAFLGEPRSSRAARAHEANGRMRAAMIMTVVVCALISIWPASVIHLLAPAVHLLAGAEPAGSAIASLRQLSLVAGILCGSVLALVGLRALLLRRRVVTAGPTWGCGYASPSARMQYTAASFAQPVLAPFAPLVPMAIQREQPDGFFPQRAAYDEQVVDMAGERVLVPMAHRFIAILSRLRVLQHGRVHLYLLYIMLTLVALLVWQLRGAQ